MPDDDTKRDGGENQPEVIAPETGGAVGKPDKSGNTGDEVLDMPPEIRRDIQAFMALFQSGGRGQNPLFSKFNDAHIDKYLDYIQRDDDHAYELSRTNRWFYLAYFVIALVVLGATVVYLLPNHKDFLDSIIKILLAMAGGIGAGYGLSKRKGD
ncbi:MAG: hypothetical protein CVU38_05080 [Chloroflexi bacterium HGW-Chloroflexi-1]|nr:MAG: hypothetical protein CVU38_05080 [Chloroflexi bacterium HGW-Chloroflexi-1]